MSVVKTVVNRPTTVFIIFALLIGLGGFALINLRIDLYPEINPPYLLVMTQYPGAGPEEVERTITRPLEAALSSVSSLEQVTSTSSKGSSTVIMEFTYGVDLADAANSVRDSLERVRSYMPTGADSPMIFKFDPSMIPIMGLMVMGNRSPEELREIADNTIVPRIEQAPGVATASLMGGREKIIKIEIPQSRLEAYGLTVTQIQQMLAANNNQIAAGTITEEGMSYILTTMGEYKSLEEIRNTVISYQGGAVTNGRVLPRSVYLRDLANVFEGYRDQTSSVLVNGVPSVMMTVQKQSGKNSVQTARELRQRLVRISREIPQDLTITELFNTTDQIENSIGQVTSTAVSGAILAILILFIFLRSIKPTIIIGLAIPISLIITIMLMYFMGLTLNLMTLAGLVLGVGMLVDNAIVILENIYHYREKGAKLKPAAVLGTQEMIIAITASTLTTICVFAPLVLFKSLLEMGGELFSGLAFTVVISLAMSLFVALFLVPVLSSHYLPLVTRRQKPLTGALVGLDRKFESFFAWLDEKYRRAVRKVLKHKFIVCFSLLILFVGSMFLAVFVVGYEFMPQEEADNVSITATLPMGSSLAQTESTLQQLQGIVEREIEKTAYKEIVLNAGGGGMFSSGSHSGSLRINLVEYKERPLSAEDIKTRLRAHFNEFPGVSFSFGGGFGGGGMGGNPIDIVLRTDDLVKGKALADRISLLIKEKIPEATEPAVDLRDGLPQIEIELDREKLYALGLNTVTVGNEIKAAVDGITATKYKDAGNDYDVVLILAEADRSTRPALDHIFINSQIAGRVPLSSFASYEEGTGPLTIRRENQSRVIHITAGAVKGTKLNELSTKVRNLITSEIPAEEDVVIEYAGDNADMAKMMVNFALILLVALFLVFGVMASLFESFKDPFIIIFTIPLSMIGIVLIYLITGSVFNILTAVGLLVLLGVIVNNGIVLVDYTNLLRKRGYSLIEACVEAAGNRLRPILMSTLTTILGLVPMAFFPGEGSELVAPIGKTVLGGLSFGTLMTLFLMPAIYALLNKRDDARRARAEARREAVAAGLGRRAALDIVKKLSEQPDMETGDKKTGGGEEDYAKN
ncbi:MAG: efflux RND transporter permease subunit [Spirochaetaceae bacterium]|jgi:HAE1 family hydrophobic/amphiphilic exporter-1|nr:efflux RND transporter permease subunit [Spirochaetaceae bacterium]